MNLTTNMRTVLEQAQTAGELHRTHTPGPGRPAWPFHHATLRALVNHELLTVTTRPNRNGLPLTVWTITDKGARLLTTVDVKRDTKRTLDVKGRARFRVMQGGVWRDISAPEPEPMEEASPEWARRARERHEAEHTRDIADRLAAMIRAA